MTIKISKIYEPYRQLDSFILQKQVEQFMDDISENNAMGSSVDFDPDIEAWNYGNIRYTTFYERGLWARIWL